MSIVQQTSTSSGISDITAFRAMSKMPWTNRYAMHGYTCEFESSDSISPTRPYHRQQFGNPNGRASPTLSVGNLVQRNRVDRYLHFLEKLMASRHAKRPFWLSN